MERRVPQKSASFGIRARRNQQPNNGAMSRLGCKVQRGMAVIRKLIRVLAGREKLLALSQRTMCGGLMQNTAVRGRRVTHAESSRMTL